MNIASRIGKFLFAAPLIALGATGVVLASAPPAAGESFYKDKTLKVIIRSAPGGGNDFYGRLIVRHLPQYIPGNPDAIAQNMPGSGGIVATNYIANRAKRDGTEIGILPRDLPITQRAGATGVRFDLRTMIPIGSAASSVAVYAVAANHPVNKLTDLETYGKTMKFSATGRGSGSFQRPMLLKLAGFDIEIISGYSGTAERLLAIARGEVDGTSSSYGSLQKAVEEGEIKVIGRLGNHPELKDVQQPREVLGAEGRALASLITAPLVAGRPFFTTPEVPMDRVKILRSAFKKTILDPKLQEEATRADRPANWTSAEEMREIYEEILSAPDSVIEKFEQTM